MAMKFEGRDRAFSSTLREGEKVVNTSALHMQRHATGIKEPVVVRQSGWTIMILIWAMPVILGNGVARIAWEFGSASVVWWWVLLGCHVLGTILAAVAFLRKNFSFFLSLDDEKIVVENGGAKTVIPWEELRKTELIETIKVVKDQEVPYHTLRLVTADKKEVNVRLNFGKATLVKVDEAFEAKGFDVTDCVKTTARNNTTVAWVPALIGVPAYLGMTAFLAWGLFLA